MEGRLANLDDMEQRVTRLEVEVSHMRGDVKQIKSDVREVRDALVGAKWAGRVVLAVVGTLGVVAGWVAKVWVA